MLIAFFSNNVCTNAPEYYVIRKLPVLLIMDREGDGKMQGWYVKETNATYDWIY